VRSGDTPRDWIRAGQALQRMLLRLGAPQGPEKKSVRRPAEAVISEEL
jgi:hypothetical protein